MTALDTRARALAERMLGIYGKSLSFTHRTPGAYDPNTSAVTVTETTQTIKACLVQPSKQQIDQGVLATSMVAMLAAADLTAGNPAPGDRFTVDSIVYSVGWTDRLWSGDLVAMWWVELKK